MTTEERRALLDRAITAYGAPAQMDMTATAAEASHRG